MRFLFRLTFFLLLNFAILFIAGTFITGFSAGGGSSSGGEISVNFVNLMIAAAIFTLINFYIRPLVKFVLSPIVFLTLGLFTIAINAGMLRLLDILSENVTITGIEPLIYGTLFISVLNFLINFLSKYIFRQGKLI